MITNESFHWCKSSFSGGENDDCIELGIQWRKSSFSGGENADCVEVAGALGAIRDSKNPVGPILRLDIRGLVTAARGGRFGH